MSRRKKERKKRKKMPSGGTGNSASISPPLPAPLKGIHWLQRGWEGVWMGNDQPTILRAKSEGAPCDGCLKVSPWQIVLAGEGDATFSMCPGCWEVALGKMLFLWMNLAEQAEKEGEKAA